MCHKKKGFCGIFVGIPKHQKEYLIYVPSTQKIISSNDVVFGETFSSALALENVSPNTTSFEEIIFCVLST